METCLEGVLLLLHRNCGSKHLGHPTTTTCILLIPRTSNLASQQADTQCLRFWVEARTVRMQNDHNDGSRWIPRSLVHEKPSAERPVSYVLLMMSKNHFLVLRNHHWRLTPPDVFCPAPRRGAKHPSYIGSVPPSPTFCSIIKPLPKEKKHSPSPLEHAFFGSWISLKSYWPLRVYLWSWNQCYIGVFSQLPYELRSLFHATMLQISYTVQCIKPPGVDPALLSIGGRTSSIAGAKQLWFTISGCVCDGNSTRVGVSYG